MKRQGRAWLLTGLLILGAGGLYLWSGDEPLAAPRPPLIASPEEIQALRLTPAGGEPLALQRSEAGFTLTLPVKTPADPRKVQSLLEQLAALGPGEAVEPGEQPLSAFGLEPAAWTLELSTDTGPLRLELGGESPFDGRGYLRVDGERLVLVSTALARRLDPRLQHWREKRMIPDPPERLDHLRLQWGERELALQRREGAWQRMDGGPVPAGPVHRLIRALTETRAVAFEDQAPDGSATAPAWEARLEVGAGSRKRSIELSELALDADLGVLARGTALAPRLRLRPGAYGELRALFLALLGPQSPDAGVDPD